MQAVEDAFDGRMAALGPWEDAPLLAVAVSGGADSMALLRLAQRWAKARGGQALALTVDHGLRPGSEGEARQVQAWCEALGMAHRTLAWPHSGVIAGNRMAAARRARYALLEAACAEAGALHLLLGHHRADQAETYAMRQARAHRTPPSAMAWQREAAFGRVIRPLLEISREALERYLISQGQDWLHDPSNDDAAYERVRLRRTLQGSEMERHARAAREAGVRRERREREMAARMAACLRLFPWGEAVLDAEAWRSAGADAGMVDAALRVVSGRAEGPRGEALLRLCERMRQEGWQGSALHGCLIFPLRRARERGVVFCRDVSRMEGVLPLIPDQESLWDGRFLCRAGEPARVIPWREAALPREALPAWLRARPARALAALPVLRLEARPEPSYIFPGQAMEFGARLRFVPPKPLAGAGFCATL